MVSYIYFVIFGLYLLFILYLRHKVSNRKKEMEKLKSIFKLYDMVALIKCLKCGKEFERPFKRFEYVFQKTNECCGESMIIGIYHKGECPHVSRMDLPSYG